MKIFHFEELTYPGVPTDFGPEIRFSNRFCDPRLASKTYGEHFDEWASSEDLGFDGLLVNEHHFTAVNIQPSCNLTAAALIMRTKTIKVGVIGNILALRHPIAVAEEFAMLDCMSGGRFIPGIVRGLPQEYISYNLDTFTGRERFEEAYQIVQKCLNEEIFDYDGKHWKLTSVSVWPKPIQKPLGPFWMPAGSMESIRFAAQNHLVSCQVFQPTSGFKEVFDAYRTVAREEFGWQPGFDHFTGCRFVYLAEDHETAIREGQQALAYMFRIMGRPVVNPAPIPGHATDESYSFRRNIEAKIVDEAKIGSAGPGTNGDATRMAFEKMRQHGWCVCGDPDYVGNWLENDAKVAGYGNLIVAFRLGNMTHEQVTKSKKLFVDKVMPFLHPINAVVEPARVDGHPYEVRADAGDRSNRLYRDFNYVLTKDSIEVVDEIRQMAGGETMVGWLMKVPERHIDGSPTEIIFPGPCAEHRGAAFRLGLAGKGGTAISDKAKIRLEAYAGDDRQAVFEGTYRQFAGIADQHAPNAALAAQRRVVAGDGWLIQLSVTVPEKTPEPDLSAEESFFELECFKHNFAVSA
jgi:alkanesulfonate monooxygenase SsuD/methylene tetrahydromethanopterin reductase-like flavin-dependent oxidoreductase (luciferase family)